jgi:hypothetical protein
VSVTVLAAGTYFAGRPKSLLDYATRVCDASDWQSAILMSSKRLEFGWLSPTEVIYAHQGEPGRLQLMRKRIDRPNEPPARVPLTLPVGAFDWKLSPDGRCISWLEHIPPAAQMKAPESPFTCSAASLDGKSHKLVSKYYVRAVWSEDSSCVFSADYADAKKLHQTSLKRGATTTISFAHLGYPRANWNNLIYVYRDGRLLSATNGGAYYDFRSLPGSASTTPKTTVDMAEYDLNRPGNSLSNWSISGPDKTQNGIASISPEGDRLFWQTSTEIVSAPEQMLRRLFKTYQVHPVRLVRLFVSDVHGNRMHKIAEFQAAINHHSNDTLTSGALWSPDGKKIGFVLKGRFYTIPAD